MRNGIIVIGSLNYDIILDLPRLPAAGETLPATGVSYAAGGKGANQAVQAAKLGVKTYMAGCVGDDFMGEYLIRTARKYGVNTEYIKTVSGASGMGIVNAVANGEVHAAIVRGANYKITRADIDHIKPLMQTAQIVVLQLEIPIEIVTYAIDAAKLAGCKVLLNAAPALAVPEEYLSRCDTFIVNEVEAEFYLQQQITSVQQAIEGAECLAKRWHTDCIITLGAKGAVVKSGDQDKLIPAKAVQAVDTTGAGDSFIGAICYGLVQGMSLFAACEYATLCSAVTVCGIGAQSAMPYLADVLPV